MVAVVVCRIVIQNFRKRFVWPRQLYSLDPCLTFTFPLMSTDCWHYDLWAQCGSNKRDNLICYDPDCHFHWTHGWHALYQHSCQLIVICGLNAGPTNVTVRGSPVFQLFDLWPILLLIQKYWDKLPILVQPGLRGYLNPRFKYFAAKHMIADE